MNLKSSLVEQLEENMNRLGLRRPERRGQVTYVFPWSFGLTVFEHSPGAIPKLMNLGFPPNALSRCPIWRALPPRMQRELILRGPKSLLGYSRFASGMFQEALAAYSRFEPGGVSPLTAMALTVPEPRYEIRYADLSPLLVIPRQLVFLDAKAARLVTRRAAEWQAIVWALKRYTPIAWRQAASLVSKDPISAITLRQGIRRNVEEPIAASYRILTGKQLAPDFYSSALGDAPESTEWSKQKMRELKRAARARMRPIPNK